MTNALPVDSAFSDSAAPTEAVSASAVLAKLTTVDLPKGTVICLSRHRPSKKQVTRLSLINETSVLLEERAFCTLATSQRIALEDATRITLRRDAIVRFRKKTRQFGQGTSFTLNRGTLLFFPIATTSTNSSFREAAKELDRLVVRLATGHNQFDASPRTTRSFVFITLIYSFLLSFLLLGAFDRFPRLTTAGFTDEGERVFDDAKKDLILKDDLPPASPPSPLQVGILPPNPDDLAIRTEPPTPDDEASRKERAMLKKLYDTEKRIQEAQIKLHELETKSFDTSEEIKKNISQWNDKLSGLVPRFKESLIGQMQQALDDRSWWRQTGMTVAFVITASFFIGWVNRTFRKQRDSEFAFFDYALRLHRDAWVADTLRLWDKDGMREMPAELTSFLTNMAPRSDTEDLAPATPIEALNWLFRRVKVKAGDVQLELDRRSWPKFRKKPKTRRKNSD